ncbi:glutamyl-tRNA reductase [Hymenobacter swuensis]|uniref:Glutamyl-tRNA reductase n=1 Tax=Hymenobacter swuensis DY53 TaxID=1227739 RepID=W8F0G4_9BACT|nr:glutamyl-tRNA reductase [Hymenobacter swuensis]AHJ95360.1 glutamyl-tRNA reductase [Hymenobacter swuensis DY53]
MNPNFHVFSLSQRAAPLAVREQLALNEAACRQLLRTLRTAPGLTDVLVLSTCNRTEIYYCAGQEQTAVLLDALGQVLGRVVSARQAAYFVHLHDAEAATRHLFDVALGLEAQLIGDQQISHQVKRAYQWAVEEDTAGPWLHRLLHTVLFTSKRVQQETAFRDGAASTSYAALELTETLTAHLPNPTILIVGLGEIGTDVARHFGASPRFTCVTVCNRTRAKAEALAAGNSLQVLDWADLVPGLQAADVVISSVAAAVPCLTLPLVQQLTVLSHKFFIDLSVPRSVAAEVEQVPGVLLYTLDDIADTTSATLARRLAAVPQVCALIAESLADLAQWSRELEVSPTIQQLKNALEQLRAEELRRFSKHLSAAETQRMDELTKSLMQKVLKYPTRHLKAACQRGETGPLVGLLTDIFGLEATLAGYS